MTYKNRLLRMFTNLPSTATRWLLDTNVWGEIVQSEEAKDEFVQALSGTNHLAGVTSYTLFELSRAERLLTPLDDLFFRVRHNVWVPLPYDYVYDRELDAYPATVDIPWLAMCMLTGEEEGGSSVMSQLAADPRFTSSRDEHLEFGFNRFMSLEQFKRNFPQRNAEGYTPADALRFATLNSRDYFRRHDPEWIANLAGGPDLFRPEGIPSQLARSLFVFYKFYIHGKSPNESDFMDFANISYLPYVDIYVTERDVLNTVRHIKSTTDFLSHVTLEHVSDFIQLLTSDGDWQKRTTARTVTGPM